MPIYTEHIIRKVIQVNDSNYFCNKSWTLSFNMNTKTWISFHSYLPNWYIGENNFFYSGINTNANIEHLTTSTWRHLTNQTIYNGFYGKIYPYIIEYPFAYQYNDEILQNVKDYTKAFVYQLDGTGVFNYNDRIEVDDQWFNKAVLYNGQQSTGLLNLVKKPSHNLKEYLTYPKYNIDSKTITYTKSDNFYQYNTFWSIVKNKQLPLFLTTCDNLSIDRIINQSNMDYSLRSFKKEPLRAKELKVRHILDNSSSIHLVSQFIFTPSQISYK